MTKNRAAKIKAIEANITKAVASIEASDISDEAKSRAIGDAIALAYGGKRLTAAEAMQLVEGPAVARYQAHTDGARTLVSIKGGKR